MRILVTGAAGFIGLYTSLFLLKKKFSVVGVDNLNNYYDVKLKKSRLRELKKNKKFIFKKLDISKKNKCRSFLASN